MSSEKSSDLYRVTALWIFPSPALYAAAASGHDSNIP